MLEIDLSDRHVLRTGDWYCVVCGSLVKNGENKWIKDIGAICSDNCEKKIVFDLFFNLDLTIKYPHLYPNCEAPDRE